MKLNKGLIKKHIETLLREAEAAHAEYEKELGHRDENWAEWYAQYIADKLEGQGFV